MSLALSSAVLLSASCATRDRFECTPVDGSSGCRLHADGGLFLANAGDIAAMAGVVEVDGDVTVAFPEDAAPPADLAGLSALREITGSLVISTAPEAGLVLPALTRVGGNIEVIVAVERIELPALTDVGGAFRVIAGPTRALELSDDLVIAGTLQLDDVRSETLTVPACGGLDLIRSGEVHTLSFTHLAALASISLVNDGVTTVVAAGGEEPTALTSLVVTGSHELLHLGPLMYATNLERLDIEDDPALAYCDAEYVAAQSQLPLVLNPSDVDEEAACAPIAAGHDCDETFGFGYECAAGLSCGDPNAPRPEGVPCDDQNTTPCTGVCYAP